MAKNSKIVALNSRKPEQNAQKPPRHLKKAGKALWEYEAKTFFLEPHDEVLLTSLCETLDRKNQAEKELKAAGNLTFMNRHNEEKPRPQVAIIRDCNILIARLRRELALSELPDDSRPPALKFGGKK